MGKIYTCVDQLIGKTPLLEFTNIEKKLGLASKVIGKLEYLNPAGSVKDRVAKIMLDEAEKSGKINKETVIIEPTSGNTGIGLASVASARGYKVIIVMPDTMSIERQMILKAYGAELVLSDGSKGMAGAIEKANDLSKKFSNSFIPGQFDNFDNPKAHFISTGPEIYEDMDGNVDLFVAGIGTGGTISGCGEFLKSKNPNIKIVGVEPFDSPILSEGKSGPHKLQGIGAGFIPKVLNTNIYDEIIKVKTEEAYETARMIGVMEGVLVGISSGAAVFAAIELAKRPENNGKNIVVLLPDTGDRYLSTDLFNF